MSARSRGRAFAACAALTFAAAARAVAADEEHLSPFIQPVPSAAFGVVGVGAVSVGVDVPLRERMLLVTEAFFEKGDKDPLYVPGSLSGSLPFTHLAVSTGVAFFHPSGPGPCQGAFIAPKLVLDGRRYADESHQTILEWGAGLDLDLGYRWRKGRLTVTLVAGLGLSYVVHSPYPVLQMEYGGPVGDQTFDGFTLDVNLNLLRLGFAF